MAILKPDELIESIFDIDLPGLRAKGIEALILDLDNTLVGWETEHIPPKVLEWVQHTKSLGFKVMINSNGRSGRVKRAARRLGVPAIHAAVKPRKRPFKQALQLLNVAPEQAVVVGDQVFTDVLGGNRMDIYTILINPVSRQELRTTRMVRKVERRVLSRLHKKGLLHADELATRGIGQS